MTILRILRIYDVDSPVFTFNIITEAAILNMKNYVPFIHWCKTASIMAVYCSGYIKCKLALKQITLLTNVLLIRMRIKIYDEIQ